MSKLLKILGIAFLVVGIIGTLVLAGKYGVDTEEVKSIKSKYSSSLYAVEDVAYVEKRSFVKTAAYFFGGVLSTMTIFGMLYGLGITIEKLEDQETKLKRLLDLQQEKGGK